MASLLELSAASLKRKLEAANLPPSSCGVVGAYAVCEALGVPYELSSSHLSFINTRSHSASIAAYLRSRSQAGMTAATLAELTHHVSRGRIHATFIPSRGSTAEEIARLLRQFLPQKTVIILTLNLQMMDTDEVDVDQLADAWHHHPVAGLGEGGKFRMIYPDAEFSAEELHRMLDCESVLLVRARDILYQTTPKGTFETLLYPRDMGDLEELRREEDPRWSEFSVVDSLYELLHDADDYFYEVLSLRNRKRIRIPAIYTPGITIFVDRNDTAARQTLENITMINQKLPAGQMLSTPTERKSGNPEEAAK
ncbi:hypothetical protein BV898_12355 [Hypsibius exemplaris]|uniref:Uncharacterized protein n=1 Tax=Hypsibius exemplaris TaxID=2072580 RepID=A0A1W0WE52_HYPEX|nr:hypothetical protein BV898_12355 [Hypsibius exemplaris]